MPVKEFPLYPVIGFSVENTTTLVVTEIEADTITVSATRGNESGPAGISSVEVGTATITLKDPKIAEYDPTTTSLLQPRMPVRLYNKDTDQPIFTGFILDIATRYEFHPIFTNQLITYVDIYAVDGVSFWGGIAIENTDFPIAGASTNPTLGYETWQERIERIETWATATYTGLPPLIVPPTTPAVLLYEKAS